MILWFKRVHWLKEYVSDPGQKMPQMFPGRMEEEEWRKESGEEHKVRQDKKNEGREKRKEKPEVKNWMGHF
jgi:hypothetical protein